MKITVVKKSGSKVKTMSVCPWMTEAPPDPTSSLGPGVAGLPAWPKKGS